MRHTEQVKQIHAMIESIDSHKVPQADKILACPATSFTDPEQAAREREVLFRNHPQLIGLSGDIDGPGSFLTLNDFNVPILATRDKDGKFHAFLNSCRHRGAQLTQKPRGKQSHFVCPYHAWVYRDDGSLLSVREQELFGEIDKKCNSLIELPAEEKYGMLWVHPQPGGELDVDALLGPELATEMQAWELGRAVYRGGHVFERPLNWKLASDTFSECYHFAVLHSRTVANFLHGDFNTYRNFGNHHRMIVPNKNIKTTLEKPESAWNIAAISSMVYYIFPNVQFNLLNNVLSLTHIFPDAKNPGQSRSRISVYQADHLLRDKEVGVERANLSADNIYSADASQPFELDFEGLLEALKSTVNDEDYTTSTQIQEAANSGLIDHLKFGRNEPGLQHAHNAIRAAIGMPPLPEYQPNVAYGRAGL
ncbi:aromatic ring-hydroxylating oxygenase subunit alpha [Pseudomonas sp. H11T01]|uniref:aromatic ring-hydroxylating oxygenase subunit alpha n=1 Tax=Pseudomonas sp. H11T01 TaxID=3402749 RepID=UPI003AD1C3C3